MATYAAIFEQAEDGNWAGYVPGIFLPILASGDTLAEAQQSMQEGIDLWTEEAKEDGMSIPPPVSHTVNTKSLFEQ
jgi:predicted RNase H-like HicB family nuclease